MLRPAVSTEMSIRTQEEGQEPGKLQVTLDSSGPLVSLKHLRGLPVGLCRRSGKEQKRTPSSSTFPNDVAKYILKASKSF